MYFETPIEEKKSKKNLAYLLLAGAACVSVGMYGYNASQQEEVEAELTELAGEAPIMQTFYDKIADDCNKWVSDQSDTLNTNAKNMIKSVGLVSGKRKGTGHRFGGAKFHSAKDLIFDILNNLRSQQLVLEEINNYNNKQLALMSKRLSEPRWKMQMAYSGRIAKRCAGANDEYMAKYKVLEADSKKLARAFMNVGAGFDEKAQADLALMDCNAMYPPPEKVSFDWIGSIMEAGKKGFETYNQVKELIPEGAAGKDGIPGLPKDMGGIGSLIGKFTGGEDMENEEEEITEMFKLIGGDTNSSWAHRQAIHAQALRACNADKAKFEKSIKMMSNEMSQQARSYPIKQYRAFPEDVSARVPAYLKNSKAKVAEDNNMSKAEHMGTKAKLADLHGDYSKTHATIQHNTANLLKLQAAMTK